MLYHLLIDKLYERNVESDGGSALVWYASHGNEVGVRNMLTAGADVNVLSPNQAQSTALLEAVIQKHTNIVHLLLKNGAWPDAVGLCSGRPLTLASISRSNMAIIKLLLDYGAKVDPVAPGKRAPLLEAMPVSISILKMAGGRTPLQVAADHSCTRAVSVLLHYGANPNFKNMNQFYKGWTALFYAAKRGNSSGDNKTIIRTLINHGAKVDGTNEVQDTPLLHAVSQEAIIQAQVLLDSGANIMARNSKGESVLHLAAWYPDMMSWLIESGADVNWAGGEQKETPIFYAIRQSQNEGNVRKLLSFGADVHFQNTHGMTPLSVAAQMSSIELTVMLLESGAFVNSKDMKGKTALHHIAESGYGSRAHEVIAVLIQHGADVNAQDYSGYTPLHSVVAQQGTLEAAAELLNAGADRHVLSSDGKFPHDMVPVGPWAETQRFFLNYYQMQLV
ncbi:hypothetical protein N7474_010094 [Penicillium riverlandense]|uniref:uncharacterized protein n=1 Tax=Penicillium riverlandense TaxID=1903569 RepID=UPI00254885A7|nr:uncharacterized protein N7474_010094 [Penicillium riverlandense]KAJ5808825.1 hypothetical protein N7474_010094 [Penicillium riverlandense]